MKKATRSAEGPPLASWKDSGAGGSGAKEEIKAFVEGIVADNVPVEERIAVFDNDGTLWGEQPEYVQVPFIVSRNGNAPAEETVEEYQEAVMAWLRTARHPDTGLLYTDMVYKPMLELLDYLRDNQFKTFIVSGGGIEFVRPWAEVVYGIPPEQVVGSSVKTKYNADRLEVMRVAGDNEVAEYEENIFIDDKEGKPVGISQHIGRRPLAAFGNSNGDKAMIEWTTAGGGRRFGFLLHHTDGNREWNYDVLLHNWVPSGAQQSPSGVLTPETLQQAEDEGWTVADMAQDWLTIYPPPAEPPI